MRNRDLPRHIEILRDVTEPSFIYGKFLNDHIEPFKVRRLEEIAKSISQGSSRSELRTLSCYVDKRDSSGFNNSPESMPLDVASVFELGNACEKFLVFRATCEEDDVKRCRVVAQKVLHEDVSPAKERKKSFDFSNACGDAIGEDLKRGRSTSRTADGIPGMTNFFVENSRNSEKASSICDCLTLLNI